MKRYGGLFARVVAFDNLLLAARKAQRGKQHRSSVARFLFRLEPEFLTLQDELRAGTYRMRPYRTFTIYEPKQRQICAADFRDRVVQHAICHVLDPVFEAGFIYDTYACRRSKGTHAAVRRAQRFSRRFASVLKGDVRKYYQSIDHPVLKTLLRRTLKDKALLALLDRIIEHPIPAGTPGKGLPIGNLTSQYFANLYLGALDHLVKDRLGLRGYVRYMDDFLIFAADKPRLHDTLATVRTFLHTALRLGLKEQAVRLAPVTQGIPFLGCRIFPRLIRLNSRTWARVRRRIRGLEAAYRRGLIDEATLVRSVTSMLGHIRHADTLAARRRFLTGRRSTSAAQPRQKA
jgi:RNA-directed DNA polymerase